MSNLRESLLGCSDAVLGVREKIGAQKADVYLIERTWAGERPGDGSFTDVTQKINPTPGIKDFGHDIRRSEAASIKTGDLILKNISRNSYSEDDLRTSTLDRKIEKFYKIGENYYRTVHIKEKFISWDVHIRKVHMDETEERRR